MNIQLVFISHGSEKEGLKQDFVDLYRDAGWNAHLGDMNNLEWIDQIIRGSFCFVGAFKQDRMIGMGRSISDGVSDAYIQDVTVLKSFRGQGIGSSIIRLLVTYLKQSGIDWIGLIAEPGSCSLYEKAGFVTMTDHQSMLYQKT